MIRHVGIIFIILLAASSLSLPQEKRSFSKENKLIDKLDSSVNQNRVILQSVFNDIEGAISSGNVAVLSKFIDSQTYFSLSNGVSGYYSPNQAYYVLEDFFKIYQVTSFRFRNIKTAADNPYATGSYNYELKGMKNSAQVYVSVKQLGRNWKISQITIN